MLFVVQMILANVTSVQKLKYHLLVALLQIMNQLRASHRMTGLKPQEHRCICSPISTNRWNQKTRFLVCVTLSWEKKIRSNGKDSRKEYKKKQRKHLSKQEKKINFENNMSDLIWFLSFSISTLSASRNWLRWREHTHHQNIGFFSWNQLWLYGFQS